MRRFFLLVLAFSFVPRLALAHFKLNAPASWWSQDALGSPQKLGPCGNEGPGMPTNAITAFKTGSKITITIEETIFHPGHYRIALATSDRSELPPEPPVTPGNTPCGSVPIQNPPMFPVLADGVLVHTQPLVGPQTIEVQLPPNVTCTKCTLQVLEFMSEHQLNNPGGCFYHHCADISISDAPADAGAPVDDASPDGSADAGTTMAAQGGCSCDAGGGAPALSGIIGFFALSMWRRRQRRRA
jgi:hypothetical protein